MKIKFLMSVILAMLTVLVLPMSQYALEDPRSTINNIYGVHILFPEEIQEAARLVNSNGGDWGYVTIPIQSGDRNLLKWQKFMDDARSLHVIPIIRVATEGDYFNTKNWRKPTEEDVVDFANFLNSLDWPVKNLYIIVFNEVNRGDEWGGSPNPDEYAQILSFAVSAFKTLNQDFFIISAGMDNASVNIDQISINQFDFLKQMNSSVPGIFDRIDGIASHSYPNPAFSQPPSNQSSKSVASFRYEKNLIQQFSSKNLPVFITETGWSNSLISGEKIASYLKDSFNFVWNDQDIIAVTPFLLRANLGPFTVFSLLNIDGSESLPYKAILELPKKKGAPVLAQKVLGQQNLKDDFLPVKNFSKKKQLPLNQVFVPVSVKTLLRWLMKI
ncbi:MAG: hypothetical protein HYT83_04120 [Candidatus Levybacteria bacterium]|nr:hypothetical protein [Candidatus Levybacteria bacterium]